MARRRGSSNRWGWHLFAGLIAVGIIGSIIAAQPVTTALVVAGLVAAAVWWWKRQQRAAVAEQQAALDEYVRAVKHEQDRWSQLRFGEGEFTVTITSVRRAADELPHFLRTLSLNPAVAIDADQILQRAEHIGPQVIVSGVEWSPAVELKVALEDHGARVKINEGATGRGNSRRAPIPERVRNEVWRRDGGACVDCGSRERLEFDHIVPVSKGGANTARNIELRCERCNRKKAANI